MYVFTQPANNSVQRAWPCFIHHIHNQVERDEMSAPIATRFQNLNESHSPSLKTKLPVQAGYPNSSRKERLISTHYSLIVHMETLHTLHSVTGFSMNSVRRLGLYTQTSLSYGPCGVTTCACVDVD